MSVKSAPPAPAARMNLFELERTSLHDLVTLVESRASAEAAARSAHAAAVAAAERDLGRARKQTTAAREQTLGSLDAAHQDALKQVTDRFASEMHAAEVEFAETKKRVTTECDEVEQKARGAYQDTRWTADSVYE